MTAMGYQERTARSKLYEVIPLQVPLILGNGELDMEVIFEVGELLPPDGDPSVLYQRPVVTLLLKSRPEEADQGLAGFLLAGSSMRYYARSGGGLERGRFPGSVSRGDWLTVRVVVSRDGEFGLYVNGPGVQAVQRANVGPSGTVVSAVMIGRAVEGDHPLRGSAQAHDLVDELSASTAAPALAGRPKRDKDLPGQHQPLYGWARGPIIGLSDRPWPPPQQPTPPLDPPQPPPPRVDPPSPLQLPRQSVLYWWDGGSHRPFLLQPFDE